jgi:pyruvate dehydrogenase E1 component
MLEEGITEAGALASFTALSTAYATWGQPMVPVYLFYSMFGFQRVGDLAWALGDMRGRGILAGCTAGRTTLMGEGLQHDDGQSPLLASTNPAALVYDASFAYEVATIMEAAVTEILGPSPRDRFWYLTLYNETYPMPPLPQGAIGEKVRRGIIDGIYPFAPAPEVAGETNTNGEAGSKSDLRASLCFSGPMWKIAADAQRVLAERYGVAADTWAVTSWTNLRTEALEVERWNRLHPEAEARTANITATLGAGPDPVVAITDYMRSVPDQVARFVDRPYTSLGTDGFGRSDARDALRSYFEVDSANLVVAVLQQLALDGRIKPSVVAEAIAAFDIETEGDPPFIV